MKNNTKAINTIFVIPAGLFVFFAIASLFSKTLGAISFAQELFFCLFDLYFLAIPFILVFLIKDKRGRVLFLLLGLFYAFVLFAVWKSPQIEATQFYHQSKNITLLQSLKTDDVAYITIGNVNLTQPEQIHPIVEALNGSIWYSPNHERRGKEVPMAIGLRNGHEMNILLSRFYNEDSADLLFTRPRESGYWADGNAFVPKLPSILEDLGYTLSPDY